MTTVQQWGRKESFIWPLLAPKFFTFCHEQCREENEQAAFQPAESHSERCSTHYWRFLDWLHFCKLRPQPSCS